MTDARKTDARRTNARMTSRADALDPGATGAHGLNPCATGSQGLEPSALSSCGLNPCATGSQGLEPSALSSCGLNPRGAASHGVDPRVSRSQQRLRDALLALTLERGWDDVNVQQICERAGIGRSTFYVHFADREELLLGAFQREHIAPRPPARNEPLAFVRPLVEHVAEHRVLYNALVKTTFERPMRRRFLHVVADMLESHLAIRAAPSAQRTMAVRFLAGAYSETLTFWLEGRNPAPAGEIERMLRQFSAPVFERMA